jgi:hypothetical protein
MNRTCTFPSGAKGDKGDQGLPGTDGLPYFHHIMTDPRTGPGLDTPGQAVATLATEGNDNGDTLDHAGSTPTEWVLRPKTWRGIIGDGNWPIILAAGSQSFSCVTQDESPHRMRFEIMFNSLPSAGVPFFVLNDDPSHYLCALKSEFTLPDNTIISRNLGDTGCDDVSGAAAMKVGDILHLEARIAQLPALGSLRSKVLIAAYHWTTAADNVTSLLYVMRAALFYSGPVAIGSLGIVCPGAVTLDPNSTFALRRESSDEI